MRRHDVAILLKIARKGQQNWLMNWKLVQVKSARVLTDQ